MAQSITINPVDGDNFINNSQAGSGITITGSATPGSGASAVGQQVTVTLNGKTYTGTINGSDDWSVSVGSTDLEALTDGSGYTVSASYTDTLGNHASNTDTVTVDKKVTLTMAAVDGNNLINNSQAASGITITGTATGSTGLSDVVGQTVTVTLNGKTYTGTVTSTGAWSVSVPSADLEALTDGTGYAASAKITDVAGNTASAGHTATVDKTATLVMNVVDGNNYIDATEYANGITITGTANDSIGLSGVSGRTVSVTFNGQTYTGTVSSTGTWSVSVPSSATSALVDGGKYLATAKMTDVAGNLVASVHNVTVDLKTYLVVNPFGANPSGIDSYVNINNAASGITINGTATDDIGLSGVVGRTVTITWNGKSYTSIISSTGTWSVNVPSADLEALTNGTVYNVVGAYSDYAGNNVSENRFVTVDRTASLTISPIDGNNIIDSQNVASGITISGTTTGGLSAGDASGQTITVTLNGKTYNTTVSSTGTWSVNVDSADLSALANGDSYTVSASGTDKAGNPISGTDKVTVNTGNVTAALDTNLIDGNNFIIAANLGGITISGVASSSAGLSDVSGQIVTVTLNGKTYTTAISSTGTWSVNVGSTDLGTLTDNTTYNVVASATDVAGNAMSYTDYVTVHKTQANWVGGTGGSGDVGTNSNWQDSSPPPNVTGLAVFNLPSGALVTMNNNDSGSGDGVILSGSGTFDIQNGAELMLSHSMDVQGGTLELDSASILQGATIIYAGGTVDFNGGTLDGVTVDGALDLSANNASVTIADGLTLNGAEGYGAGAINLTGVNSSMYVNGNATLDNAILTIGSATGYGDILDNDDMDNTGSVLTLGKNFILNENSFDSVFLYSNGYDNPGDGIVNNGTINALGTNGGTLYVDTFNFTNQGNVNIASGGTLYFQANSNMLNTASGNITVSAGGVFSFGSPAGAASNAGTITATDATAYFYNFTNTGTLNIQDSSVYLYTTASTFPDSLLTQFTGKGNTIYIDGELDNTSETLTVGTGSTLGNFILASDGTIDGGTIVDQGSGISFQGGALQNVTYDGTMDLSADNSSVYIIGGLTTHAQNGTGPGTINLTGNSDALFFQGNQAFDNATITLGSATGDSDFIFSQDIYGEGAVLTLGSNLTININSYSYTEMDSSGFDETGDGIINKGAINVEGTNSSQLYIEAYNFTNQGTINVAANATLNIDPAFSFANSGTLNDNGGITYVFTAETGNGTATIGGTGEIDYMSAATDNVTFKSGSTGTLVLASSATYNGTITGFTGAGTAATSDKIDLQDISFTTATKSFSGGMLTVSDGTHTAKIKFAGSYVPGDFSLADDGSGGTLVYDPPVASDTTETTTRKLVQSMASFGTSTSSSPIVNTMEPQITTASNVTNPVHLHH